MVENPKTMRALWQAAAERFERRELVRNEKGALIRQGDWTDAEEASRIRTRLSRKGIPFATVDAVVNETKVADSLGGRMLERILKGSEIQGVAFLTGGARTSRVVGRVVIRANGTSADGYGTGFMVSPTLMLTNNHVIGDQRIAENSLIQFDYQERKDGSLSTPTSFGLDPSVFFITDVALDFTLVAVQRRGLRNEGLEGRGWLPLIRPSGKILVGENVNLIQHPEGGPMQIAIRENPVVDVVEDFLHYRADTLQGSSGAPVCNDDWDLAALHHSSIPKRNENQDILLQDGSVWDGSDAAAEHIEWVANEGVRISRIVAHLDGLSMTEAQRALYAETFQAPASEPVSDLNHISSKGTDVTQPGKNEMAFYFKVTVSQVGVPEIEARQASPRLSGPLPGAQIPGAQGPGATLPQVALDTPAATLARGLIEENGPRRRVYYDKDEDHQNREEYYEGISFDADSGALFESLSDLMTRTHTNKLSYKTARLKHLYPWIDLRPHNLELFSIYSDDEMGSQEVIRRELEALVRRRAGGAQESTSLADLERLLDDDDAIDVDDEALEAISGEHNCEHVVPQSWFDKRQPMKADLHHLFACEMRCNSFRSNIPYFDFDPTMESERGDCGRRVGDKFEPTYNHGVVARASLYFLLRYPGEMGNQGREFQPERLETLIRWHKAQKVDLYELHRNAEIAKVQGNRNPLIDFPDLIDDIDFERGFG